MSTKHSYAEGMVYEALIRRAHKDPDRSKNGADASNMTNLIDAENGESWVRHLPKFDKQLSKVRTHLTKAWDKMIKWAFNEEERATMEAQRVKLAQASTTTELMEFVRACLAVSQRFKED